MESVEKDQQATIRKYLLLTRTINTMQLRLALLETIYLLVDVLVLLFTIYYMSILSKRGLHNAAPMELSFVYFLVTLGISICAYWIISSMRLHMRLKLRYFQARALERKLGAEGEYLFTDEEHFNHENQSLTSFDGKETIHYPANMDGVIASAKPRVLTVYMPFYLCAMFGIVFVWTLDFLI